MRHFCFQIALFILVESAWFHSGCSPSYRENQIEAPTPPGADRQAWALLLNITEPDLTVEISTPFIEETGRRTVADSGASISFMQNDDDLLSRIRAARMEFDASFLSLSGRVELVAEDSLQISADSLLWDREAGQFRIPQWVEMRAQRGRVVGANMKTDLRLADWSLEQTTETWWIGDDSLAVTAGRQLGHRSDGEIAVSYEDVSASFAGLDMNGDSAHYDEKRGALRLEGSVSGSDSSHRFEAGRLDYELRQRSFRATGTVSLASDSIAINAAEFTRKGDTESFRGDPAEFRQGERYIAASRLSYNRASGFLQAAEGVSFRDGDNILTSARLTYDRDADSVAVEESFRLSLPAMFGVATGGDLRYAVREGHATLRKGPSFRRERDDGSQLSISAETIFADLNGEVLDCEGSFQSVSAEATITAASGLFEHNKNRLTLGGDVDFRMRATADSIVSFVQADSMGVDLEDGKPAQVDIPDSLSGSIGGGASRINWIAASAGTLFLEEDALQSIELRGGAEVTHRKLGAEEISRFSGTEMTLEFGDRLMQRVYVRGNAAVVSRIPDEEKEEEASLNRVEGERLVIEFSHGELAAVRLLGSIKGRYFPPGKTDE
jgi:lipopolysaccharide export system protein LptA